MRINQFIGASFLALSLVLSPVAKADQIENESKEAAAPRAILVKVNPETRLVEVFRATSVDSNILSNSASSDETARAISAIESPANKIAEYTPSTKELDKDTSTQATFYNWYGYNYRWNNWGGYRPYYYNYNNPYAYGAGNFYYYNYSYNYRYSYGYNNCNYGWYY